MTTTQPTDDLVDALHQDTTWTTHDGDTLVHVALDDMTPDQAAAALRRLRAQAGELHARRDRQLIDSVLGTGNPHDVVPVLAAHRLQEPDEWLDDTPLAARLTSIARQPAPAGSGWFDAFIGLIR